MSTKAKHRRQPNLVGDLAGALLLAALAVPVSAQTLPALAPAAKDKCPVCGMFVAKYPDWVAQIRFKDQKTVFFDGAKDLFKYYFRVSAYDPGRSAADIGAIYVTDYYTVTFIDAAQAFFVVGSDIYGPMGRELIAFSSGENAKTFMRDHSARDNLRFEAVSLELLRTLD
jgi:nitrous oxide reductase accessory protein NosL